ncbi:histidine phosphatase family protein [Subtercola boreus]|uniref:Histidine phosphatase family protein n=1 Tax=Subtercola boreus TaxID=120213 RepID=A0A3E0WE11_9MICO|nr:histidine phosphatase family protein [Subtercola boreus]RFA22097.1 histidine phosphatase family protein [Subtercola boreus]RFA22277.1 histidine phosphatase family protein [Subtercola boreus]RFA28140.1 histidine phosphatase family protein [Subtercola boreus]
MVTETIPPKTGQIVLVRHGETAWSLTGQHTGTTDLPLTAHGEDQARAVGRFLQGRPFSQVLVSPRIRARRTAELVGYADEAVVDPNLAEWDYGAYEGLTSVEIVAQRGAWNLWRDGVPAGATPGENNAQVQLRALSVLSRVRADVDAGDDVLLVAHGHILRALAAAWVELAPTGGQIFSLATSTLSALGYEHGAPVILLWNAAADERNQL